MFGCLPCSLSSHQPSGRQIWFNICSRRKPTHIYYDDACWEHLFSVNRQNAVRLLNRFINARGETVWISHGNKGIPRLSLIVLIFKSNYCMTARDLFPDLSAPSKPDASPRDIFTEREGDRASAGTLPSGEFGLRVCITSVVTPTPFPLQENIRIQAQ